MATNLTVGAADRNYDSTDAVVLTTGGTIAVNNNYTLRIDGDTGYCRNAATPLSLTLNASSGGKCIIDGRDTWWVPFSSSSGNVPSFTVFNDLTAPADVQRSGIDVGAWLGFYPGISAPPVIPGLAIPASGFLKLRYKSIGVTFANADVLTFPNGATVTLSGPGQRGWIAVQINGVGGSGAITVPRLGDFKVEGDFFELGETKSQQQVNGTDINDTNNKIYFRLTNNCYIGTIANGNYASASAFATAVQTAMNAATQQSGTAAALTGTFTVTAMADNRLSFTHSSSAFNFNWGNVPSACTLLGFDFIDQLADCYVLTATGAGTGSTSSTSDQLAVEIGGVTVEVILATAIASGSALATEVNTRLRAFDPGFYCVWNSRTSRMSIYHKRPFSINFTLANNPAAVMGFTVSLQVATPVYHVISRVALSGTTNTVAAASFNYLVGINDGADKKAVLANATYTSQGMATQLQTQLNAVSTNFTVATMAADGAAALLLISRTSSFTLKWSAIAPNSACRAMGFTFDDSTALQTQVSLGPMNFGAENQTFDYYVKHICPGIQVETAPGSGTYEWYNYVPQNPTIFMFNVNSAVANTGRWNSPYRTTLASASTVPADSRGKCFSMLTTGSGVPLTGAVFTESQQIVLALKNGLNDCGYAPPQAGCKVRVPNVHLGSGFGRLVSTFGFSSSADTTFGTSVTAPGTITSLVVAAASFNDLIPFRENGTDKIAILAAATYVTTSSSGTTTTFFQSALSAALNTASNGFNQYSVTVSANTVTISAEQPFSINYLSNAAFITHLTAATRPEFVTTSAGAISMKKCASHWYLNLSAPFSVLLEDMSTLQAAVIANVASTTTMTRTCISPVITDQAPLTISSCFSGGTITDSKFFRYLFVTPFVQLNDCSDFTISGTTMKSGGLTATDARRATNTTATAVAALDINRCTDTVVTSCKTLYGRFNVASSIRTTFTDSQHGHTMLGYLSANGPGNVFGISGNADTITITGLTPFDDMPYMLSYNDMITAANFSNLTVRSIGTPSAPLNAYLVCPSFLTASTGVSIDMRRLYMDNMRGETPIQPQNTLQNVTMINLWGKANSTTFGSNATNGIDSVNNAVQGCRWTLGTSGQTACYGFHWTDYFISTVAGRVAILCNEPLASTASQCEVTAGSPVFTSTGSVAMPTLGDQVTWTCPYYVLGYTAFTNSAPGFTQSAGNYSYEYQIDPGTGTYNGVWKTLNQANLITETISPSTGFKLKVRSTTTVANAANTITQIQINMTTNSTDQQIQYPLPLTGFGTITSISAGSRIQLYNETKAIELVNEIVPSTSFSYNYDPAASATSGDTIRLRLTKLGFLPYQARTIAATTSFGFLAEQASDSVYTTNAIDGSTVAECTADFTNDKIDIDDGDDTTTVQRLYAFYRYAETLSTGIGDWFNAVLAVNTTTYVVSQTVLNLTYNNVSVDPLRITGGRWTRADGSTVKYVTTNPIWTESVTVSGLQAGSRLQIYNGTTASEQYNAIVAGASYQFDFSIGTGISTGNTIRIRATLPGYVPFETSGAAAATETSFTVNQSADTVYNTNAVDGTTVAECTANYGDNTIEINDSDDTTSVQRIYAFYRVAESTSTGINSWFGTVTASSASAYSINTSILNLRWNNTKVTGVSITGGRWDRSNGSTIAFPGSNPILMEYGVISSIVTGSRIQIYNVTTAAEIVNTTVGGTSYSYNYANGTGVTSGDSIRIRLTLLGQLPYQSTVTATASGFTLTAAQTADSVYTTNAINGSTVAECSADYVNNTIDINDSDDSTSVQRIYAFYRFTETTSSGIGSWHAGINAIDTVTYQIIVGNVDLTLDNTKGTPLSLTISGGRLTRSNGSSYIYGTSNPIRMEWGVISNIVDGSRIQIYNSTSTTQLVNATVSGTSYSYNYNNGTEATSGNTIRIRLTFPGRMPFQTSTTASASGFTVNADQSALDTVYTDNGVTGSSVTECAANYGRNTIDITDGDDITQVQRIYAWYRYNETTSSGIANWFNVMSAVDATNYLINVPTIDLTLFNTKSTPLQITNARLYRSNGSTVIYSTSNSIQMDPDKVYSITTGGSALTTQEHDVLISLTGLKPLVIAGL